jgi:O-methyltransferase
MELWKIWPRVRRGRAAGVRHLHVSHGLRIHDVVVTENLVDVIPHGGSPTASNYQSSAILRLSEVASDQPASARRWCLPTGSMADGTFVGKDRCARAPRDSKPPADHETGSDKCPDGPRRYSRRLAHQRSATSADRPSAYSLSDVRSVVDVGGGSVNLLAALLRANPGLHGTIFERPSVAKSAVQWLHAACLNHHSGPVRS